MCICSTSYRIPRSRPRGQYDPNGPYENQGRRRMAIPKEPHRRSLLSGVHRLLPVLHPQLLARRAPPARPNKESDTLDMERSSDNSVRNTKETHVLETSLNPTTVRQTVRSTYGRIGIWHGRHTLTRGRNQPPKTVKTSPPPHRVLLGNLHTNGEELRHL